MSIDSPQILKRDGYMCSRHSGEPEVYHYRKVHNLKADAGDRGRHMEAAHILPFSLKAFEEPTQTTKHTIVGEVCFHPTTANPRLVGTQVFRLASRDHFDLASSLGSP